VLGSEARLGQVFLNLLLNAAQAIGDGDTARNTITLRTRVEGGRVVVEVQDTGCGIPADALGRIFDPFYTTKPSGVGTGLGLSICHGIVRSLGGELSVESAPGVGSVFRVALPIPISIPTSPAVRAEGTRPPRGSAVAAQRRRVLIIDDEPTVVAALARTLGDQHEVVSATGGRQALAIVRDDARFDVILCDLLMPDLTGMEVHAELSRAHPGLEHRIIFMTGGAFTPGARRFLESVPNRRVEKPFDLARLRGMIV
jgi:CheY-like chemotaxis protein